MFSNVTAIAELAGVELVVAELLELDEPDEPQALSASATTDIVRASSRFM
jgi:hypothetical protein